MQPYVNYNLISLAACKEAPGILAALFINLLMVCISLMPTTSGANEKILSLDQCTDWMLARYARQSQVLALSPPIYQYNPDWLGDAWARHDGTLEQIMDLKPDLVITGEFNAMILRQRLQELGINVEILKLPKNLTDVISYEERFLSLIGQPVTNNSREISQPSAKTTNKKPRLLLLGANGIGTGRGTFEDDILKMAGWDNYLKEKGYINLDLEKISADPPEAILWSVPASAALSNLFAEHPVLKKAIPKTQWLKTAAWKWQCPGPWTWDLISELKALSQSLDRP